MKDKIRKSFLDIRLKIPFEDKMKLSDLIQNNFIQSNLYKNAETIFVYISMQDEVSTSKIIKKAIDDGKIVAVPIALKNRDMYFVPYSGTENLVKTKIGVLEPVSDRSNELIPDENSIMVVPGVAFDEMGHRMGYGGGYYDTYIERHFVKNTVALAFGIQVQKSIPYEDHDKTMKYIITEKKIMGGAEL